MLVDMCSGLVADVGTMLCEVAEAVRGASSPADDLDFASIIHRSGSSGVSRHTMTSTLGTDMLHYKLKG